MRSSVFPRVLALVVCASACRNASGDSHASAAAPSASSKWSDADVAYQRAVALITPYLTMARSAIAKDPQAQADLREGIRDLDTTIGLQPDRAEALWARGQAQQAIGDHEGAYESLRRAYTFDGGKTPDIAKELVLECLETGRGGQGVNVAQAAIAAKPDDDGMVSNLALAYLIDGKVDQALDVANRAVALDPQDDTSASARQRIVEVKAGKRPPPHTLQDLLK